MKARITPKIVSGSIAAIASKSVAHRLLICAAFSKNSTSIRCENTNNDILATVDCLNALGANIVYKDKCFIVDPIEKISNFPILNCNESGSTLRFLLPVSCAISESTTFLISGRLPERPLSPLKEELEDHGITFNYIKRDEFKTSGMLKCGDYTISGEVSSQFISGLLFALSIIEGKSSLTVTGNIESAQYIKMTLDALNTFGANIDFVDNTFIIYGTKLACQNELLVEGDWSNAAFPLCAAALGGKVTLNRINLSSNQGDKEIINILKKFGANVQCSEGFVSVTHNKLHGIDVDASQIPDLVPVIAAVAAGAEGTTRITGASRLRIKESDRIMATKSVLSALGADVEETDDGLIIYGKSCLSGGTVSSYNDHRIAMSAAVASVICKDQVIVNGAEAVNKSYPDFWLAFQSLGANVTIEN